MITETFENPNSGEKPIINGQEPPLQEWLEDLHKKLDAYIGKEIELMDASIKSEQGIYRYTDGISGELYKDPGGQYKIIFGKNNKGENLHYYFDPSLVKLEENPTNTVGVKSLRIIVG